jgi:hypothetical protein
MTANKAETGKKYLTKTGIPVTVVGAKGAKIVLKIETTGNKTDVDGDYELRPYDEDKLSKDARLLIKAKGKSKSGTSKTGVREGSLAAIIDPMLFAGEHSIKEIAAELMKKAGAAAKGKDLEANVRARLFSHRKKGASIQRDAQKRLRVVLKKG